MKPIVQFFCVAMFLLFAIDGVHAQEIWGMSTLSFKTVTLKPQPLVSGISCPGFRCYQPKAREISAYADTEEDYVASLYYDVTSSSAIYTGGNSYPWASQSFTGNPSASGSFLSGPITVPHSNLASEVTDHIVDFFYVSSYGGYYDPYGFSVVLNPNNPDGDYNTGYWFSVVVYATYVSEASVLLGQDFDAGTDTWGDNFQGPNTETLLYQAFIPPDWVTGPPASNCLSVIYAGDNRTFDPSLESFRAMQSISVGVGGYTAINEDNAPPAQATGWTYQFSSSVLQNNMIPATAYNYDYLNHCSSRGINAWGHAGTDKMYPPSVVYTGSNMTGTSFSGAASNPLVPLATWGPITWNVPLTLTEPSPSDLNISGSLNATCYPAHEVSMGGYDLTGGTWMPQSNSLVYIANCLLGVSPVINQKINMDIPLIPPQPLQGLMSRRIWKEKVTTCEKCL